MADDSSLDKILDRLPYSDGTGRRRFVAGGILLTGTVVLFFDPDTFKNYLGGIDTADLLGSPILLLAAILILYALGNLTEMLAGLFLVRMASGVMWTVGFPQRASRQVSNRYIRWIAYVGLVACAPFYLVWEMIRGLRGDTRYRLPLEIDLSPESLKMLDALPHKVRTGLYYPVSNDAEFATKYMVDRFITETDRRWARRLLGQADDVSSVTTAFILIAMLSFTAHQVGPDAASLSYQFQDIRKTLDTDSIAKVINEAIDALDRARIDASPELDIGALDCYAVSDTIRRGASWSPALDNAGASQLKTIDDLSILTSSCSQFLSQRAPHEELPDNIKLVVAQGREAVKEVSDQAIAMHFAAIRDRTTRYEESLRQNLLNLLLTILFLFLYVGYFKTLHNAVVNIVEASLSHNRPTNVVEDVDH